MAKGKLFGFAGLAILCFFCFWGVARSYPRYKEQRLTAQTRLFLKEGKHKEAMLTTQQLLRANPRNPEACSFMAELTERAKDPSTLVWRRQAVELSPTLENRLLLAKAALLFERPPFLLAQQTLEEIQARHQETARYHAIAGQLATKLNRLGEAETNYEAAIKLEPQNESHQLNLAVLRLQSKDPQVAAAARSTLEQLCANPRLAEFALRSLVSVSVEKKDLERAREFSEKLLAYPQAGFGDRVQHLSILHGSRSTNFHAFLSAVRDEASTNEFHAYQLSSWMNSSGMTEEALAWLESLSPHVKTRPPVPTAIVECLITRMDWPRLESFLNEQQWGEQDFVRTALLALALRNQNLDDSAELRLQGAVRLASKHAETLIILRQMFESWGWQSDADEMLRLLVKGFAHERWVSRFVSLAYYSKGNTQGLYEIFRMILDSAPKDPLNQNNFAMSCLLLNTNLNQAQALAAEAYRSRPNDPAVLSTFAYSLHVQGKNSEAVEAFKTMPKTDLETPRIALYYAITLAAAGEIELARKYSSIAQRTQLLPEEKKLLERLSREQK